MSACQLVSTPPLQGGFQHAAFSRRLVSISACQLFLPLDSYSADALRDGLSAEDLVSAAQQRTALPKLTS
jgi:hypothetical protein